MNSFKVATKINVTGLICSALIAVGISACADEAATEDSSEAAATTQSTNTQPNTGQAAAAQPSPAPQQPAAQPAAAPEPEPAPACSNCGRIASITPVEVKGQSSGGGAIIGAIVGGVVGHQFGSGSGNDAATAAGAVGGAVAGNEIERRNNSDTDYEIRVDYDAGGSAVILVPDAYGLRVGDRVRVQGNQISRYNN